MCCDKVIATISIYDEANEDNQEDLETEMSYNMLLIKHAPEMLSRLESFINGFECDYVLDGEIVDEPYEWLIEEYKKAKQLITKATTI